MWWKYRPCCRSGHRQHFLAQDIGDTSSGGRGRHGPSGPPLPTHLVPGSGQGCSIRRVPDSSKTWSESWFSKRATTSPSRERLTWNRVPLANTVPLSRMRVSPSPSAATTHSGLLNGAPPTMAPAVLSDAGPSGGGAEPCALPGPRPAGDLNDRVGLPDHEVGCERSRRQ